MKANKIAWANLPIDARLTILTNVAEKIGLPENAVEKDYWVSMVLRALFSLECSKNLVFKGGTSLSKGWNLIERFSEDIDLAINPAQFGFVGTSFGKSQRDKLRRLSKLFVEKKLRLLLEKSLCLAELGNHISVVAENVKESDRDPMVLYVNYRSVLQEKRDYIYERVKLEVSCRSLLEPSQTLHLQSMIALANPQADYAESPFNVETADPRRTFLEKVFMLHEEFLRSGGGENFNRFSRHIYDIERMMDQPFAHSAIADSKLYAEIVEHRSIMTAWHGVDYKSHHPSTIAIVPPVEMWTSLKDDYKKLQNNFIYGKSLDFEKLMLRIEELQSRLRQQKNEEFFFNA